MDERKEEKRKSRPTGLRSGGRTESEVRRGETRKMLPKTDRQTERDRDRARAEQTGQTRFSVRTLVLCFRHG